MVQLIRPRRFDPWLCELRDRIGGRPERFELCGADVTEVAVPSVLWGSGPELMQFSRVCAGPAAVVGTYRVQQVLCKGFDGCVLPVRRGCVEPGHEFSVGGAGGGEVLVAFFELKVGVNDLLFERCDALLKLVDVGGGAESGCAPCLFAE